MCCMVEDVILQGENSPRTGMRVQTTLLFSQHSNEEMLDSGLGELI